MPPISSSDSPKKTVVPVSRLLFLNLALAVAAFGIVRHYHTFFAGLVSAFGVMVLLHKPYMRRTRRKVEVRLQDLYERGCLDEARALTQAIRRDYAKNAEFQEICTRLESMLPPVESTPVDQFVSLGEEPATVGHNGNTLNRNGTCGIGESESSTEAAVEDAQETVPGPSESPAQLGEIQMPRPADPVASSLCIGIWVLAIFALLPLLGLIPALILAVCSLVLLMRRRRRPWDRQIATAGASVFGLLLVSLVLLIVKAKCAPNPAGLKPGDWKMSSEQSWALGGLQLVLLFISVTLHECAHGLAAWCSGDSTAADEGRITLNPLAHVDPFGTLILPAILAVTPGAPVFGWARPVPIDPTRFRRPRRGLFAVTLAGVSANLFLALAFTTGLLILGCILRMTHPAATSQGLFVPFAEVELRGVAASTGWIWAATILKFGILINMNLLFLNLLPIPPLDGFGVLQSVVPRFLSGLLASLRLYGWLVFLILIMLGVVDKLTVIPTVYGTLILTLLPGMATGFY